MPPPTSIVLTMRFIPVMILLGARLGWADADQDEHGHGHRHKHPHPPDPHHHHDHDHPHPAGEGHHHPFTVELVKPAVAAPPVIPPPPLPQIHDFSPKRGPAGTSVAITGAHFGPNATVHFNGRAQKTLVQRSTRLAVTLPDSAKSDVLVVRHPGRPDATTATSFVVEPPPVITALSPTAAAPGTAIEIRGRNFLVDDRVLVGDRVADVLSRQPHRLEVVVPEGTSDGRVVVLRDASRGVSPRPLRLLPLAPVIVALQPPTGQPGTTLRIQGRNFLPSDRAMLGRMALPVLARGPEFIDATVPAGARSGEVRVVGPGREARADLEFTVVAPPEVTGIKPAWATPGSRVTISGRHFLPGDVVLLGDKPASDLQVIESEISFTVPDAAASGPVAVVRGELRAAGRAPLEIVLPPVLRGFEPEAGPGGTRVTLHGQNLSRDARVRFGSTELKPLARKPDAIEVQIPRGATDDRFTVTTRGGEAQSASAFAVQEPAQLLSFEPGFGPVGAQVVLRGRHFTNQDTVSLHGQDLPVLSASPDALTVQVPAGARPGPFVVRSRGKDLTTRQSFRVVAPPPLAVLSFAPMSGPPGTEVAIRTGRRFTSSDRVMLDGAPLLATLLAGGAEARVRIPAGARSGRLEVVMGSGERVVADQPFQVVEKQKPVSDSPGVY